MRKLVLTTKTGFRVKDVNQPINIRDDRGILFYTTEFLVPKVKEFNLPKGTYFVDSGSFTSMAFPRSFPPIILPPRERFGYPNPKGFEVIFDKNPNKCSVDWNDRVIIFDNSFKDRPWYEIDFIMNHEFGHRFYKTEKYCDLYAAYKMYKMGYNTYQIGLSSIDSLSDNQVPRKEFLIDNF